MCQLCSSQHEEHSQLWQSWEEWKDNKALCVWEGSWQCWESFVCSSGFTQHTSCRKNLCHQHGGDLALWLPARQPWQLHLIQQITVCLPGAFFSYWNLVMLFWTQSVTARMRVFRELENLKASNKPLLYFMVCVIYTFTVACKKLGTAAQNSCYEC